MRFFIGFMVFVVVLFGSLGWFLYTDFQNDNEFKDRCEVLGGVVVMTKGDDLCLDPEVVLDRRDQ